MNTRNAFLNLGSPRVAIAIAMALGLACSGRGPEPEASNQQGEEVGSSTTALTGSGAGICSNDPTVACGANADCGAGTCYVPTAGGATLTNQICMADAFQGKLQCTAKDIKVAQTTNLRVLDGCDSPDDTATISFVAEFLLTAQDRYDVGVWVAQDGGDALTGTCSVTSFPTSPSPPWVNLDAVAQATDTCGDIDGGHNPLHSSLQNIVVSCLDLNADGFLDINACLSWRVSGNNDVCTSPLQAYPGAPSKCNCVQVPGIAIPVPGEIIVQKITDPSSDTTTSFSFNLGGGPTPVDADFTLTGGSTWNSHTDGAVVLPPSDTAYVLDETETTGWDLTSATCTSDQTGRSPTPGHIVIHSGETVTCVFTNTLTDLCAGVTCSADAACATYACDPADGVCKPTYAAAGTECRASAGACDVAESCTGTSASCPADAKSTAVCRASAGACDVAESCDGAGDACPADGFQSAATECRASGGACDPAELCTGTSASCPADAKSTAVCRASAGACDVAESCDGVGDACPVDSFQSGTECRASGGACDPAEVCTGASASCPADAKSTAVCRASAGPCDLAESCNGVGDACPADGFQTATECRASGGDCDPAELCTGASASCPADAKSTAVCRASAGACDLTESCDGVGDSCPADTFQSEATECRASGGACDPAELCTGASAACPTDAKSTAVCRVSAGVCDLAESCDGVGDDCPEDAFQSATTECRASGGACDPAELCTGASASCPADAKSTGVCRPAGEDADCEPAELCDGTSDACPADTGDICDFRNDPQIAPTGTTCQDYSTGASATLATVRYTIKAGVINSVSPGVLFVYDGVHLDTSGTIAVTETDGAWTRFIGVQKDQIILYDTDCNRLHVGTITTDANGNVTITDVPAGDYILSIKYNPETLRGYNPPTSSTTFTFEVTADGVSSGSAGVLVTKKH